MLPLSKEEFFFELLGEEGIVPDGLQSQQTQWLSGRMNGIRWQIQV
jgi:hypothetical protein